MRELGIARVLVEKRRERGITQDELAEYVGVTKASVSKWETEQSYPDITLLPVLAAYFGISVDELIGYSPQLARGEIRNLYRELAAAFARRPFAEVMGELRAAVRKYHACPPLVYQMAALIVNHAQLAQEPGAQGALYAEAAELCAQVRMESDDVRLAHDAALLEAACSLLRGDAKRVFDLLGEESPTLSGEGMLVAQAHQIAGHADKARAVLQVGIYQSLVMLVGAMPAYLLLSAGDAARVSEIVNRACAVADAFELEPLNSNCMAQLYLAAAQAYSALGRADDALSMLGRYADLCASGRFSYALRGDAFFDALDPWIADFDLGADPPRSRRVIEESMLAAVEQNPAFESIANRPGYARIVERLRANIGG